MAEEKEAEQAAPEQKKNKAILFVIIGILAVLILLVGVLIAVIMISSSGGHDEPESVEATQSAQASAQGHKQTPVVVSNMGTSRGTDYTKVGPIIPIEREFKVNLITQTGKKYLITRINLELDKPETQPEIDQKMPMIVDKIIDIISSKSLEEVSTPKGKGRLKDEIVQAINEFLIDGAVRNVFFDGFLIG